jgi:hypothetical protein
VIDAWTGVIGAVAGAMVAGGLAVILDARSGKRAADESRTRTRFEREERRHDDRKSAYAEFAAAMRVQFRRADQFIERHGASPAEQYGEYITVPEAVAIALATLELFAPDDTREAARTYRDAASNYDNGQAAATEVLDAEAAFSTLARRDLRGDVPAD